MSREYVATSKNGIDVYIDSDHTNMGLHIVENPKILELSREVIELQELVGSNVAVETDLGRVVGTTSLVETVQTDEIVYARRRDRDSYSRFVKGRSPEAVNWVTVILHQDNDCYLLWSAWVGRLVPSFKDEDGRYKTVASFWDTHALIYEPDLIELDTETTENMKQTH